MFRFCYINLDEGALNVIVYEISESKNSRRNEIAISYYVFPLLSCKECQFVVLFLFGMIVYYSSLWKKKN